MLLEFGLVACGRGEAGGIGLCHRHRHRQRQRQRQRRGRWLLVRIQTQIGFRFDLRFNLSLNPEPNAQSFLLAYVCDTLRLGLISRFNACSHMRTSQRVLCIGRFKLTASSRYMQCGVKPCHYPLSHLPMGQS